MTELGFTSAGTGVLEGTDHLMYIASLVCVFGFILFLGSREAGWDGVCFARPAI